MVMEEFRISVSQQTLGREVRSMGYRKLSARPRHHAQDADAVEALKSFPCAVAEVAGGPAKGKVIEIWFQDEARIGQKNKITRRWAKRGSRPSAPHDQRTRSAYIFGAICPKHGKAAALVMPWCDTHAMNQHLIEISRNVADDAHAILIMDQAGWHMSNALAVPENITILPLPPKSPELNPVENIWQFMRENWLSNRVFKSYEDIVDHCCDAWNKLTDQPWRIMSINSSNVVSCLKRGGPHLPGRLEGGGMRSVASCSLGKSWLRVMQPSRCARGAAITINVRLPRLDLTPDMPTNDSNSLLVQPSAGPERDNKLGQHYS